MVSGRWVLGRRGSRENWGKGRRGNPGGKVGVVEVRSRASLGGGGGTP